MKKISWYYNRLRAMNAKEILWRLEQKKSQHREKVRFANSDMDITSSLFYEEISHLSFDAGRLGLNFKNKKFGVRTDIHLLGGYDYEFINRTGMPDSRQAINGQGNSVIVCHINNVIISGTRVLIGS